VTDPETKLVIGPGQRRCKQYASLSLVGWLGCYHGFGCSCPAASIQKICPCRPKLF